MSLYIPNKSERYFLIKVNVISKFIDMIQFTITTIFVFCKFFSMPQSHF